MRYGDFGCNFIGDFDGSSRKNCVCGQLLILFVPVAQVVGMPMGIVTAMATAIVVAVTRVNCVEVIHTKTILCYDDTMMRHRDSACTEIGGQLKRWYWPWGRKTIFNCRPKCQSLSNFRSKWLEYPTLWCRTPPPFRKGVVATVTALAA